MNLKVQYLMSSEEQLCELAARQVGDLGAKVSLLDLEDYVSWSRFLNESTALTANMLSPGGPLKEIRWKNSDSCLFSKVSLILGSSFSLFAFRRDVDPVHI